MPDYQIKNKLANLILFFKVRLNQYFLTRYQTWTSLFWSLLKTRSPIPIPGSLDNPSSKTKTKKFPDGDGDVDVDLVRSCSSKSRLEMESIEGKRHHLFLNCCLGKRLNEIFFKARVPITRRKKDGEVQVHPIQISTNCDEWRPCPCAQRSEKRIRKWRKRGRGARCKPVMKISTL